MRRGRCLRGSLFIEPTAVCDYLYGNLLSLLKYACMRPSRARYLLYFMLITTAAFCGCSKEAKPGSSTTTSSGSIYTRLINANRKYHHTIEMRYNSFKEVQTKLNDTSISFQFIDDATISINGVAFLYHSSLDTAILIFENYDHSVYTEQLISFNYKLNTVELEKDRQVDDSTFSSSTVFSL